MVRTYVQLKRHILDPSRNHRDTATEGQPFVRMHNEAASIEMRLSHLDSFAFRDQLRRRSRSRPRIPLNSEDVYFQLSCKTSSFGVGDIVWDERRGPIK